MEISQEKIQLESQSENDDHYQQFFYTNPQSPYRSIILTYFMVQDIVRLYEV
jgi:hypothetical protein